MPLQQEMSGARPAESASAANLRGASLDEFVAVVAFGSPLVVVDLEREGVQGRLLKDLADRLRISRMRFYDIVGVPRATAEKKAARGELVKGTGAIATVGLIKLLAIAQQLVANSTAQGAADFDTASWLGRWIERPQPALGGRRPAELIESPTGLEMVSRLLGSAASGAYQ